MGKDEIHIVAIAGCAAAAGDDDILEVGGGMQHLGFEATESLFAEGGEETRNGVVVALLKGAVEVEKVEALLRRQAASKSRLAAVHISHEVVFHFFK